MTGDERHSGALDGPPWSVDLLADLHAGVLDPSQASQLRRRIEGDPEAMAVLTALDATVSDLADLPPLRMPDDVAARMEAAIAREVSISIPHARNAPGRNAPGANRQQVAQPLRQPPPARQPAAALQQPAAGPPAPQQGAEVVDMAAARRRRTKAVGWSIGLLAGAAAIAGVVFSLVPPRPDTGKLADPTIPGATELDDSSNAAPMALLQSKELGPLSDPARLQACLKSNGLPANSVPLGGRGVKLKSNGKHGYAILFSAGAVAKYRFVVVSPDCGADPNRTEKPMVDKTIP